MYVFGCIQIGIMVKPTRAAVEAGSRKAVAPRDVATSGTPLACVARDNTHNAAAYRFCFVGEERRQLRETPCVKPAFGTAPCRLHFLPNVREVFNHGGGSRFSVRSECS